MIPHVAVDKILGLGLDLHLHARVPHELEGGVEVVDLLDTLVAGLECLAGVLPLRQRFNQLYEKATVTVLNIHHPGERVKNKISARSSEKMCDRFLRILQEGTYPASFTTSVTSRPLRRSFWRTQREKITRCKRSQSPSCLFMFIRLRE